MFRQISLIVAAIALIAGFTCRPSLSMAAEATKHKESAISSALIWLANHQLSDGRWSLHDYNQRCIDKTCTGQSDISSDAGATALGLLPFLAYGQTHKSRGPYKANIRAGIEWLIQHQQPDGNLAKGSAQMMYGHGLATIALSEAYGLTGDRETGNAAQAAVNFIVAAQDPKTGGWRYNPKDPGDTCVLGWQLTALNSAHMAGLDLGGDVLVNAKKKYSAVFVNAGKYLDTVAIHDGAEYGYQPGVASSPTMTAVGLLGRQILGAKRDSGMLVGGMQYLMNHLPDEKLPNIYYWYYGTQVMHHMSGGEWDTWNRKVRDLLVRTQVRNGDRCANGSWDPARDAWGKQGGRVMETSLSCLALEVAYRYLPIFKTEVMGSEDTDRSTSQAGTTPQENQATESDKKEPEKFGKVEIGEVEEMPPAELDADPVLQKPTPAAERIDDAKPIKDKDPGADPAKDRRGSGNGFSGRSNGSRQALVESDGDTKHTERAVVAALVWLANHQTVDGSWSVQNYTQRCKDKSCTGAGEVLADAGATAMGLLPFLAAGQTHKSHGPYKEHITRGIDWLVRHQRPDGNLAKGAQQMMYSHGLATIALCEAYGLTGDRHVGMHAQAAVNFILKAQNAADGGWRYNPGDPGDTSVTGWQLMALKSAHLAGLDVGGSVFSGTSKWLDSVAVHDGAEYAYQPGENGANTMTAVGLLCRQYLGAKRDNPMLTGGAKYLMSHLPDEGIPNIYYWYFATQVMHNLSGNDWDTWNHKMRETLVRTQVRDVEQCANGSWDPEKDGWGRRGGRVMQTSLSVLTLEVYYRYLPLYKRMSDPAGGK